jgi:ankyrin repeat protein
MKTYKIFGTLFSVVLLSMGVVSCDRHRSRSSVEQIELIRSEKLSNEEDLLQAFFQKDYPRIKTILEDGVNIDAVVLEGKNLLLLAVEGVDFQMTQFLIENGADPDLSLNVNSETLSARAYIEQSFLGDQALAFEAIFSGELETVSYFLFLELLNSVETGSTINLEWVETLLLSPLKLSLVEERDFLKLILARAYRADNFENFLQLVSKFLSDDLAVHWLDWTEKPFAEGRYRRANCVFYETPACVDFEQFLKTCDPRMSSRLMRVRSAILPYLESRNILLGCALK